MHIQKLHVVDDFIWQLDSRKPGPSLMIVGGMHGNEQSGIRVVEELVGRFAASPETLVAGKLTLAIGNPEAVKLGTRGSAPHLDLNRAFTREKMDDRGVYEHRRAAALLPWLDQSYYLLDLHATNKPSEPFLAVTKLSDAHERLFQCFDCAKIVLNENTIIPGMAQGWVNDRGGTALVYESGQADDLSRIENVRQGVERVLRRLGLVAGDDGFIHLLRKERFHIREALLLTDDGFRFEDGRGLASFEPMAKGDAIGHAGLATCRAPFDGVLMFPKIPSLWKVGAPLVFYATRI